MKRFVINISILIQIYKSKFETQCYQIFNNKRNESDLKHLEKEESVSNGNVRQVELNTDSSIEFPNKVSVLLYLLN